MLDTLRKDAFDAHFDWHPGIRFENAWSTSGWTVPVHGTLFTGLYPCEAGVIAKQERLTIERPVLAEVLSESGYTTRGFSANANICDAFDFTRGFDEFHHSWRGRRRKSDVFDWGEFISRTSDQGPSRYVDAVRECITGDVNTLKSLKLGAKLKARDLDITALSGGDDGASAALELVESFDFGDDEFLFLNLMEAHGPYNAPPSYASVDIDVNPSFEHTIGDGPGESAETIRRAYDDCVRYLSDVYEDIFAVLADDFDYVITLSDHGEMFGRDGIWTHNYGLYPDLTHIPMVIYEGSDTREWVSETVGLLDVYHTITELVGCPNDDRRGRDLTGDCVSEEYLVERFGLRSSRVQALEKNGDPGVIDEYDHALRGVVVDNGYAWETGDDFRCTEQLDPDIAEETLHSLREDLDPAESADDDRDVPEDVKRRLDKLGYVTP